MNVRAHVIVSGRVQGVYFRFETHVIAKKHDVNGWVRNLADGRVEAIFEGKKENVDRVIEFCRRGPRGARVTHLEVEWQNYKEEFKDFEVRFL